MNLRWMRVPEEAEEIFQPSSGASGASMTMNWPQNWLFSKWPNVGDELLGNLHFTFISLIVGNNLMYMHFGLFFVYET